MATPTDDSRAQDGSDDEMLNSADVDEEVQVDEDHPMSDADSENDPAGEEEISLQNDSIGHFDTPRDSLFCIASHPLDPSITATGGGDDTVYVFSSAVQAPLLPTSYESNPDPVRSGIPPTASLTGHKDSVNALAFTLPNGEFLCSAGLDGQFRVYKTPAVGKPSDRSAYALLGEVQEVEEISWIAACPHPDHHNVVALGANDGSVWIYTIDASDSASPLIVMHAIYQVSEPCTAGTWSPDGKLLAAVWEDGSLYVYDPFGDAAAAGVVSGTGLAISGLGPHDARFAVEGGLYSVAVTPTGAFVAVGGAGGMIRIVGLPRLGEGGPQATQATQSTKGGARSKAAAGGKTAGSSTSAGQTGQILASLRAQSDGVETLSFSQPPSTLLAAGSVDGSIAVYDTSRNFAVRRHIKEAHEGFAVVQVSFSKSSTETHLLTSCGMDGVVRIWDIRGGTAVAESGLVKELKGHRGGGEGGGVFGFVDSNGRIVTAGDDGISLVFNASGSDVT